MNKEYEIVIGLEIHCQLATNSKAFCGDSTAFGNEANTQTSPVSLAHPGTLPVANRRVFEYAARLGLALGCHINRSSRFDRKNYFYADLPKGYQITQDALPICTKGTLQIDENKIIRINRIHIEEDAGKSTHDQDPHFSLIDLNRAGVPLLEIVSEPDLRSSDEAYSYISEIRRLVRWLGIADGNMEEGSLRCDCNVSVRPKGETAFGTRCEIKNVNSIRNAKRAIDYEAQRQIAILEAGGEVIQQTRSYDAINDHTETILRDKEDAHDYRYFPEPDLPPVTLSEAYIENLRAQLPELPNALRQRMISAFGLSGYDASILTDDRETADFFLELAKHTVNFKAAANLIINKIKAHLNENGLALAQLGIGHQRLADFIALIDAQKVSAAIAYQRLFPALAERPDRSPLALAEEMGLVQNTDKDFLQSAVESVVAKFPDKVAEYQKGKKGLLGFFMGEVMKESKGKAEPKAANRLLVEALGK
jgi:aspartyl-tRNA(Asn)/glutamyl-tRNA(Gln) amidotransferase subunit B